MQRIASLFPAGTDMLVALGLGDRLVAVSHACDHPAVSHLPRVSALAAPLGDTPAEIDASVSALATDGLYRFDTALLADLQPALVVAQDVCHVCAPAPAALARALPAGARLLPLAGQDRTGFYADLRALAAACGVSAEPAIAAQETRLAAVARAVAGRRVPRVLALEWADPPYLGGHWVPEMIALAGGHHLLAGPGEASRRSSWAEIEAAGPELLLFMPCGYSQAEAARQDLPTDLPVHVIDANRLTSRLGPNLAEAVEVLAGILHPGVPASP
jgi:iron complex transport system substrate-binding protein